MEKTENSKIDKFGNIIKESICKYSITILLFLIPISIFLYLNIPLSESSVRGEHWALLARYVENVSLTDKIKNIALFAFPGIERPQYFAFFVPYIPYSIFGIDFSGYAYFSYFLHIVNGLLIVSILRLLGGNLSNRFWAFSFFVLSFLCSDVINWTFFSYIQLNTLLILTSICLLIKFEQTGQYKFFYIQSICVLIACFIYEISFTVLFIQILYLLVFNRNAKLILILCINIAIALLAVVMVFKRLPNEADAINVFHLGIIYRSAVFFKNLLSGFFGFYPMSFTISNIVELNSRIEPPFLNTINITIIISTIILVPVVIIKLTRKVLADKLILRLFCLIMLILGVYVAVLCFARTPFRETYLMKSYFDGQFRYYYLPSALICIVFFMCPLPQKRLANIGVIFVFGIMVLGNGLNTFRLNTSLSPYSEETIKSIKYTKAILQTGNISTEPSNFIPLYYSLWKNIQFLTKPSAFDFIHNAAEVFTEIDIKSKLDSRDKVVELSKTAIQLSPTGANSYYVLAVAYVRLGRLEEAVEHYKKAINLAGNNSHVYYNLGLAYAKLGLFEDSIDVYKKEIELMPNKLVAYNNLGNAYAELGRFNEAVESYQKAIQFAPAHMTAYYNLGNVYEKLGLFNDSAMLYQKALIMKPDEPHLYINFGNVLVELGKTEEAIEIFKKAIGLSPADIIAYDNLGSVYEEHGRFDEAVTIYQELIRLHQSDADHHYKLGLVYEKKGQKEEAIKEFKEVLRIKPDSIEAQQAIEHVHDKP